MTLLITIGVIASGLGIAAIWILYNVDIEIGPTEDHPSTHPLFDDMRLSRVRDEAEEIDP